MRYTEVFRISAMFSAQLWLRVFVNDFVHSIKIRTADDYRAMLKMVDKDIYATADFLIGIAALLNNLIHGSAGSKRTKTSRIAGLSRSIGEEIFHGRPMFLAWPTQ